jgi:hypothetical protein
VDYLDFDKTGEDFFKDEEENEDNYFDWQQQLDSNKLNSLNGIINNDFKFPANLTTKENGSSSSTNTAAALITKNIFNTTNSKLSMDIFNKINIGNVNILPMNERETLL